MGLKLHSLFTVSAAFGLLTLLPLLEKAKTWGWSFVLSLLLALGLSITAGFQPAFSPQAPQRLNITYAEQAGKASWIASPVAQLPDALRKAANFSAEPQSGVAYGYAVSAGAARLAPPTAAVTRNGDEVTLELNAPGDGVRLEVPAEAKLQSISLNGAVTPAAPEQRTFLACVTPDCGHARVTLKLGSPDAVTLKLVAQRRGLPPDGKKLHAARPADAVPSQSGDQTLLAAKIAIPAR